MKLRSAEIVQFRSIRNLTIEFEPSCLILLGINETGKTNILRALSFLSPATSSAIDNIRQVPSTEPVPRSSHVQFVLETSPEDRQVITDSVLSCLLLENPSVPFLVVGGSEMFTVSKFVDTYARELLYTANVHATPRILQVRAIPKVLLLGDWLSPTDAAPANHPIALKSGNPRKLKEFALIASDQHQGEIPGHFIRKSNERDFLNVFAAAVSNMVRRLPECIYWSHTEDSILPSSVNFDEFTANPASRPVLKNLFDLVGRQDINQAVAEARRRTNGLRTFLDRVSHAATTHLRNRWNEFENLRLELRENGSLLECTIGDVHGSYDFVRRSDGFRRFVSFLLAVSSRSQAGTLENALLLYDEPDTSLHPTGARQLRSELLKLADRNLVVYSTHSIFMVDPREVPRHLIVTKRNEETIVERATYGTVADEEVLYQVVGYSVFDIIGEKNIVFEGYRDKAIFEIGLKNARELQKSFVHVGRCFAQGVKHIPKLTPLLELANRECLIVTDADKVALEAKARYEGYGQWMTYADLVGVGFVTAEDFIRPDYVALVVSGLTIAHPELAQFGALPESSRTPVMESLVKCLAAQGVAPERRHEIAGIVKDALFKDLDAKDVRGEAVRLVEAIAPKV
jgi:energy-coupling factor transporter ATP-binding protein EcfA2